MSHRRGFSLVELLVVLAIIGVLVGFLMPAVQIARESSRRMSCSNNLKQISFALLNFENANRELPAGRDRCDNSPPGALPYETACVTAPSSLGYDMAQSGSSVFVKILPFIEEDSLFDQFHANEVPIWWSSSRGNSALAAYYDVPAIRKALNSRPSTFVCPSDTAEPVAIYKHDVPTNVPVATGSYAAMIGSKLPSTSNPKFFNSGVFMYLKRCKLREISDGLSGTIFFGETHDGHRAQTSCIWSNGNRGNTLRSSANTINTPEGVSGVGFIANGSETTNASFGSRHPGGALFAFGDGHATFISDEIDHIIYKALSTRASGEILLTSKY